MDRSLAVVHVRANLRSVQMKDIHVRPCPSENYLWSSGRVHLESVYGRYGRPGPCKTLLCSAAYLYIIYSSTVLCISKFVCKYSVKRNNSFPSIEIKNKNKFLKENAGDGGALHNCMYK